ncbi:MAG TPA: hypothetical protein VFF04_00780 [Candidatus Babeliales bacterium]|nr:hypothetical protein [Candidatus Babeliales bacterium]
MNLHSFLLFLMFPVYLISEMKQDPKTFRYYSWPMTREINQNEYHIMVWNCKDIISNAAALQASLNARMAGYARNGSYLQAYGPLYIKKKIEEYLQRIATPTSVRLLEDLRMQNFII